MSVTRSCVFCGGAPLTQEHVWPRWLVGALPGRGPYRFEHKALGDEDREWERISLDLAVRRVCASCNSGWLSDLEDRVKPLLEPLVRGKRQTLRADQADTVALWCVKTALLFQYIHPDRRTAPDEHYRWLYEKRRPPPNVFAWLAAYSGTHWSGRYVHQSLALTAESGRVEHGYCATATAGALVFQVTGFEAESELEIEKASEKEPYIAQVWPAKGRTLELPPRIALNDDALAEFADPFGAERGPRPPRPHGVGPGSLPRNDSAS